MRQSCRNFSDKEEKKDKTKAMPYFSFLTWAGSLFYQLVSAEFGFSSLAFKCHQNQLSWHTHPILLLPILFFLIGDKYLVICQYSSSIYQYDLVSCSSDNASLG